MQIINEVLLQAQDHFVRQNQLFLFRVDKREKYTQCYRASFKFVITRGQLFKTSFTEKTNLCLTLNIQIQNIIARDSSPGACCSRDTRLRELMTNSQCLLPPTVLSVEMIVNRGTTAPEAAYTSGIFFNLHPPPLKSTTICIEVVDRICIPVSASGLSHSLVKK